MNFSKTILPAVTAYDVSGPVVAVGKNLKIDDDVFGFLNMQYSGAVVYFNNIQLEKLMDLLSNLLALVV